MNDRELCPKCGYPRAPEAVDCPACGIVFARYDPGRSAARRRVAPPPPAGVEGGVTPPPPPSGWNPPPGWVPPPAQPESFFAPPAIMPPAVGSAGGSPPPSPPGADTQPVPRSAAPASFVATPAADPLSGSAAPDPYAAPATSLHGQLYDPLAAIVSQHQPLARRGTRLIAALLDGLSYLLPMMMVIFLVFSTGVDDPEAVGRELLGLTLLVSLLVFAVHAHFLYENGQTLGKKALGIKIVRTSGDRASLGRILGLRMLLPSGLGSVPLVGPFFALADILFIFREDHRCIHDHMADTKVVEV